MSEEAVQTDEGIPEEDTTTVPALRSWGLSGEPIRWADDRQQPVIAAIRAVNTGFGDQAMVQSMLDATYPEAGFLAADVCLAHPPTGAFTVTAATIDPEVDPTPYAGAVRVELTDDEDLGLPDEVISYDFGDGTPVVHDVYGHDHGYVDAGEYTISLTEMVAGVAYGSSQTTTVAEPAGTAATKSDEVDEVFDPGEHTVAEVHEYLDENPDEAKRVVKAERKGKARAGILDAF